MAPLLHLSAETVFFEKESWKVTRAEDVDKIKGVARFITLGDWGFSALILGYASGEGDARHNWELSRKRANSVQDLLIGHGVRAILLTARGQGSEPAVPETAKDPKELEKQRQQNRRVEITLSVNAAFVPPPSQPPPPDVWGSLRNVSGRRQPRSPVIRREELPDWIKKPPRRENKKAWKDYMDKLDEWQKDHHMDLGPTLTSLLGLRYTNEDAPPGRQ